ncbi:8636_t:CDS:2, partial [Gigaspora margarita]
MLENNEVPKTHGYLNNLQQKEICKYAQQNPNTKYVAKNQFHHRPVKFSRLELAIRTWVQQIVATNMSLNDHLLRKKGI